MRHLCFFSIINRIPLLYHMQPAKDSFSFRSRNHNSVKIRHKQAATLRILRENHLHFSAKSFHISHFLCEMLKFCRLFLLILFGIS